MAKGRHWRLSVATPLILLALAAAPAWAEDGQKIFQETVKRDAGYVDYKANVTMLLREADGKTASRKLEIHVLEGKNDGARTLVTFNSPADVRGTKILTASHGSKADEQWIFLPAFKRVKQISTANQSASFMGSEFSYEDINSISIQVAKFSYNFVRSEQLQGTSCFVVERSPKYEHSSYQRQVVWIDSKDYLVRKIDYYDKGGAVIKTLTMAGYQKFTRFFRPKEMTMVNNQTKKSTTLVWEDYRFNNGLRESDFDFSALKG